MLVFSSSVLKEHLLFFRLVALFLFSQISLAYKNIRTFTNKVSKCSSTIMQTSFSTFRSISSQINLKFDNTVHLTYSRNKFDDTFLILNKDKIFFHILQNIQRFWFTFHKPPLSLTLTNVCESSASILQDFSTKTWGYECLTGFSCSRILSAIYGQYNQKYIVSFSFPFQKFPQVYTR